MTCLTNGHLWEIPIDVFNATVYCVYDDNAENWADHIDLIQEDSPDEWLANLKDRVRQAAAECYAATVSNRKTIVMLFQKKKLTLQNIVHESVHAAYDIIAAAGIRDTNSEVEAYLTAYIFNNLRCVLNFQEVMK